MLPKVNRLGRKSEEADMPRPSLQSYWLLAVFSRTKGTTHFPTTLTWILRWSSELFLLGKVAQRKEMLKHGCSVWG